MIQYLLFGASKLLNINDIAKRIGNFFKLQIQLFQCVSYPEFALLTVRQIRTLTVFSPARTT